jgi:hypothetical protein
MPLEIWFPSVAWKHIERVLLFLGVLGALAALITGNIARVLVRPDPELVLAHSNFAYLSAFIYGILLSGEIVSLIKSKYGSVTQSKQHKNFFIFVEKFLCNGIFSKFLAFIGLVGISITGMLGGVMVYGLSADPFAGIILKLLGIN